MPLYEQGTCANIVIDATLITRSELIEQLRINMHKAQQIMKHQVDKKRIDHT